jgi:ABC-type Zn2+ transport system substrate-binding protein/surface adhesin
MQNEENHGDDDDDVNESAGDMKHKEPAQPRDEQNDGKYQQHFELPPEPASASCVPMSDGACIRSSA